MAIPCAILTKKECHFNCHETAQKDKALLQMQTGPNLRMKTKLFFLFEQSRIKYTVCGKCEAQ